MSQYVKKTTTKSDKDQNPKPENTTHTFDILIRYTKRSDFKNVAEHLIGYVDLGAEFAKYDSVLDEKLKRDEILDIDGKLTVAGWAILASYELGIWVTGILILANIVSQHLEKTSEHAVCHINENLLVNSLKLLRSPRQIRAMITELIKHGYLSRGVNGEKTGPLVFNHDKMITLEQSKFFKEFREAQNSVPL